MKKKQQKRNIEKNADIWVELGLKSFARFYALDIEDALVIASNPNDIFYEMIAEMNASLSEYEDFMVRIKKMDVEEKLTRLDFLDL
jgi:hypothetical protein